MDSLVFVLVQQLGKALVEVADAFPELFWDRFHHGFLANSRDGNDVCKQVESSDLGRGDILLVLFDLLLLLGVFLDHRLKILLDLLGDFLNLVHEFTLASNHLLLLVVQFELLLLDLLLQLSDTVQLLVLVSDLLSQISFEGRAFLEVDLWQDILLLALLGLFLGSAFLHSTWENNLEI